MSRRLAAAFALSLAIVPAAPAAARDPVTFARATRTAEVELTAPAALDAWPAFRNALTANDRAKLEGFFKGPGGLRTRKGAGPQARNWRRIGYEVAGSSRRLASVIRRDDAYTGGAHPMATVSGVIWDQRTKRRLPMGALFRPDADMGALDKVLCDAVKLAKRGRPGAVRIDGATWRCPAWSQASAALAPSTAPRRAGGLVVLINPAEVGPYVEGAYRVPIPYARFRRALRPAYAEEFAGAPSPRTSALLAPPAAGKPRPRPKAQPDPDEPGKPTPEPVAPGTPLPSGEGG